MTNHTSKTKIPLGTLSNVKEVEHSGSVLKKWNEGISQQKDIKSESLNVQMIPLSQIKLDPDNSRSINITLADVRNGPKLLSNSFVNDETEIEFKNKVELYFENHPNKEEKIVNYTSLAFFAASIGDPTKLINPITVYLEGMQFCLLAGHRRTLAHYIMGANKIAARIVSSQPNKYEHSLLQWKENKDREDLSLHDEIDNIRRVVGAWEEENEGVISVRKLMTVLSIKKTKAACYLSVTRSVMSDKKIFEAIKKGVLSSLELSYNICLMKNKQGRDDILNELLSGNKLSYKQAMARIKNQEITVLLPQKEKLSTSSNGLKIVKTTNIKAISKIIKLIIKSPEFKNHQHELAMIDTNTKPGILAAWQKIYELLGD